MQIEVQEAHDRMDAYLAARLDGLSRSRIQELIREQHILLNGRPAKPRDQVKRGMEFLSPSRKPFPPTAAPQDIPLEILYEDEHLLVLAKEHGIVVHPAPGNPDGTVVNALLHHCNGQLSGIGGVERPGIVHRLDKDTSGCLVVAKTDAAHQGLTTQFSESGRPWKNSIWRLPTAFPTLPKDTVFTHIGRHPVNRQKMAVVNPPGGKTAITDYEILATEAATKTALVLCHLHTGRTHQIRVHLHHKGTPILGDPIYGKKHEIPTPRLMLHAWQLAFLHPVTRKKLYLTADPPREFRPWLDLQGKE